MAQRKSPFRWPGGKHGEVKWILDHMPTHDVYVEAFGGSGTVLFQKRESSFEVYNDRNGDLVNLMRVLRDRGDELVEWLSHTPFSREIHDDIAEKVWGDADRSDDPLVRAGQYFYLRYSNWGSKVGKDAGFGVGYTRDSAESYDSARKDLERFSARLDGVHIERLGAVEVIEKYDSPDTVHYIDPPYPDTEGYGEAFDLSALGVLSDIDGEWMLSLGQATPDVLDPVFTETRNRGRALGAGANDGAKKSVERLWCSFDPTGGPKHESATADAGAW